MLITSLLLVYIRHFPLHVRLRYYCFPIFHQNMTSCGFRRVSLCELFMVGHCSLAIYQRLRLVPIGDTSPQESDQSYLNICKGLTPHKPAQNTFKEAIFDIDPIYLVPVSNENEVKESFINRFKNHFSNPFQRQNLCI